MEEKERLEKLEPAEALADRGEKTETIEAGNGRKDRREASLNMDGELSVEAVRRWLLWAGLAGNLPGSVLYPGDCVSYAEPEAGSALDRGWEGQQGAGPEPEGRSDPEKREPGFHGGPFPAGVL